YKQRWQIETAFRAMKSSGFNIEDTHLADIDRIEKLFSIVMVAFARAYVVGIYVNDNVKPIRVKNDGKRVKSLFKYGLEFIAYYLNNPLAIIKVDIFKFLSCT
ncbi:MAG: transposase, partial [Prevotellaceae bacterium]|nr:transposase [Prevotellaceae bacterium]